QIQTTGSPTELRRQLFREQIYTLDLGEMDAIVLQSLPPNANVSYQSGQLQLRAAEGDGMLTAVLDTLRQHNISIRHIASAPPTLEEVFNHFTKEEG
ncbi:MAG: DUF4162 domain-containing protein, partial [Chloroflexi bacterium]|nr:DUF4162 domain-containing protein [Chloroflexota bacterium]